MAISCELMVFSQIAHVLEGMLEGETGVGRLGLPFACRSTRRFREGDFDGGYKSFSCAKRMFMFAQEDPVYAQDFFDHLVEEGALDGEIEDMNESDLIDSFEHVEQYIPSKGDRQKGKVEQRNHDQREQERDKKHHDVVTIVENIYDNHKSHENDDREVEHNLECERKEEPCDYVGKLSAGPYHEEGNGGTYEKGRDRCEEEETGRVCLSPNHQEDKEQCKEMTGGFCVDEREINNVDKAREIHNVEEKNGVLKDVSSSTSRETTSTSTKTKITKSTLNTSIRESTLSTTRFTLPLSSQKTTKPSSSPEQMLLKWSSTSSCLQRRRKMWKRKRR